MSPAARGDPRFPWERPGEELTFATPEQIEVRYRVAGFGARIAAALLDRIVVWLIWLALVVGFAVLIMVSRGELETVSALAYAAYFVLAFVVQLFYFVWSEVRNEGRTWGKRLMRLRTVMLDGRGLTFAASLLRNLARIVDDIPVFWILPACTRGHRRAGDLVAGTLVIDESRSDLSAGPQTEEAPAPSYRELAEKRFFISAEAGAKVFPDDLNLLEHLFLRVRRYGLEAQRRGMLSSVAAKYITRLSLEDQRAAIEADPKRFLQELYLFTRDKFEGETF